MKLQMTNENRSKSSESSASSPRNSNSRESPTTEAKKRNSRFWMKKYQMNVRKVSMRGRLKAFRVFRRDHGFSLLRKAHQEHRTRWFLKLRRGTTKSFEKCLRAHVLPVDSWLESAKVGQKQQKQKQITAVLSFDGMIALTTDRKCRKSKWKVVNLVKLLPMEPEKRGGVYELGCCDLSLEQAGDCLAILAVFWIEVDTKNTPSQCFGSIYRITKQLNVVFCELIPSPSMVACCRLTDRKKFTGDQHCLLVFSKDAQVSAYQVEPKSIEKIEDVFDWFPSLALTNLPGGALRTSCKLCDEYRYSAVGLDTGVLIVSVCTMEGNVILDSVRLRYASPISVVEFLPEVSSNVQRLLISSFMGPAGIWRLKFADDKLTWEFECTFERSQYYDSILSACVYRFYHGCAPVVFFGTFSGKILCYELPPPTKEVQKVLKNVQMNGKPINLLLCHGIYFLKQTGFNEISALTPFGLYVLRENVAGRKRRLTKFASFWMEKYQKAQLLKHPKKRRDFTASQIRRRATMDSDASSGDRLQMRPRAGSTVSHLAWRNSDEEVVAVERRRVTMGAKDFRERGATQSVSGSSNGSSSRLRQLDVAVSDLYYQDGPSDPLHSPNRNTLSPRIINPAVHPQSPLANRPQPGQGQAAVFFRSTSKSLTSPPPRITK